MTDSSGSPNKSELLKQYEAEGWSMRFGVSGSRLKEMIDMYESMGLETLTVPYSEAMCGGCTICLENEDEPTMMILTRVGSS